MQRKLTILPTETEVREAYEIEKVKLLDRLIQDDRIDQDIVFGISEIFDNQTKRLVELEIETRNLKNVDVLWKRRMTIIASFVFLGILISSFVFTAYMLKETSDSIYVIMFPLILSFMMAWFKDYRVILKSVLTSIKLEKDTKLKSYENVIYEPNNRSRLFVFIHRRLYGEKGTSRNSKL